MISCDRCGVKITAATGHAQLFSLEDEDEKVYDLCRDCFYAVRRSIESFYSLVSREG